MTYTIAVATPLIPSAMEQSVDAGSLYLADGTYLMLVPTQQTVSGVIYYDYDLYAVSANRTTATSVVTSILDAAARLESVPNNLQAGICRDTAGGIYVVWGQVSCHTRYLTKGVGLTWSKGTVLAFTSSMSYADFNIPAWCNTGGGTSGVGHIFIKKASYSGGTSDAIVLDAGIVKQGSGAPLASMLANAFPNAYSYTSRHHVLPNDAPGVVGAVEGWWAHSGPSTGASQAGYWSVSSAGVCTPTVFGGFGKSSSSHDSPRILRISSTFALVVGNGDGARYGVTSMTKTGFGTYANSMYSTGITNAPVLSDSQLYRKWDAAYDRAWNRIWIYGWNGTSITRIGGVVNGTTGITWDTTPATTEATGLTADVLVGPPMAPPSSRWDWYTYSGSYVTAIVGGSTLFNQNPYAPTLTGPVTGAVNLAVIQRLSFTFFDPDIGDSLSKWDIQWSSDGGTSWTTVTRITTNAFWDAPAATFPAGGIVWHARTYDAAGAAGPYSGDSTFTAATTPGVPSITAPTSGSSIAATTATVTWSAGAQTDYQIRKVADVAGVADPSTVYYDSGDVVDTVTRLDVLAFPVNARWEHIQVSIKDAGLWSAWADCRVWVNWDEPMTPTIILTPNPAHASIVVAITNPAATGSAPDTAYNNIFASSPLDPEIRIATQILPNTVWEWCTPAAGRTYNLRAEAVGTTGTTASST